MNYRTKDLGLSMRNFQKRIYKKKDDFRCTKCGKMIAVNEWMGTAYRNHCPFCLWSKHVDWRRSGDRTKIQCLGSMRPVGLAFKHAGVDRYGKPRQGELMLVHMCQKCERVNINRIAADDDEKVILGVLAQRGKIGEEEMEKIEAEGISLLGDENEEEVKKQLFGKQTPCKT